MESFFYRGIEIVRRDPAIGTDDYPLIVTIGDEVYGLDDFKSAVTLIDEEVPLMEYRGIKIKRRPADPTSFRYEVKGEAFYSDDIRDIIGIIDEVLEGRDDA